MRVREAGIAPPPGAFGLLADRAWSFVRSLFEGAVVQKAAVVAASTAALAGGGAATMQAMGDAEPAQRCRAPGRADARAGPALRPRRLGSPRENRRRTAAGSADGARSRPRRHPRPADAEAGDAANAQPPPAAAAQAPAAKPIPPPKPELPAHPTPAAEGAGEFASERRAPSPGRRPRFSRTGRGSAPLLTQTSTSSVNRRL